MRPILDGSLMKERPTQAITFVDNHDSQPLQALESPVESWIKTLAYALILLVQGDIPVSFYTIMMEPTMKIPEGIAFGTRFAFHHTVSYWISSFSPDAADISPSAGADSTRKFA